MTNEELRMQMLAGIITESEYKAKLTELPQDNPLRTVNKHTTLVQHANLFFNFLKNIKNMKVNDKESLQKHINVLKTLQRNLKIAKLNYPLHLKPLSGALNYVTEMIDGIESMGSAEEIYDLLNSGYIVKEFLDNVIKPINNLPLTHH